MVFIYSTSLFYATHAAGLIIGRLQDRQPLWCFIFRGSGSQTAANWLDWTEEPWDTTWQFPCCIQMTCVVLFCAAAAMHLIVFACTGCGTRFCVPSCRPVCMLSFLYSCIYVFMFGGRLPSSAWGIIKARELRQRKSSGRWIKNGRAWQTLIDRTGQSCLNFPGRVGMGMGLGGGVVAQFLHLICSTRHKNTTHSSLWFDSSSSVLCLPLLPPQLVLRVVRVICITIQSNVCSV